LLLLLLECDFFLLRHGSITKPPEDDFDSARHCCLEDFSLTANYQTLKIETFLSPRTDIFYSRPNIILDCTHTQISNSSSHHHVVLQANSQVKLFTLLLAAAAVFIHFISSQLEKSINTFPIVHSSSSSKKIKKNSLSFSSFVNFSLPFFASCSFSSAHSKFVDECENEEKQ
jgi:hypothetical protein